MSVDFSKIWESKRKIRQELRALPFVDKLRILERLRDDLLIGLAQQRKEAKERCSKRPVSTSESPDALLDWRDHEC